MHITSHANFGPWYEVLDATARIPSNSDGCVLNEDLTGHIAVIDRGNCFFSVKTRNAQNAGAVAVIILNNGEDNDISAMNCGDEGCDDIDIPTVFITNEFVDAFRDTVVNDPDHIYHIGCDQDFVESNVSSPLSNIFMMHNEDIKLHFAL